MPLKARRALILLPAMIAFAFAQTPTPARLYATYLREGFTPVAITTGHAGSVHIAGNLVASGSTSGAPRTVAVLLKLDAAGTTTQYERTFGASGSESASALAADDAENAYVLGTTTSPDFPSTPGNRLAEPAARTPRAFVVKLNPSGEVVFSAILPAQSAGAIAVTRDGEIIVTGSSAVGLSATPGALSLEKSTFRPYVMKLDASATKIIYIATGIGGGFLALDPDGNTYIAGNTTALDYPTTPGAFQTVFEPSFVCSGLCQIGFPGLQQYVSKIDAAGSKLLYSTGLNGTGAFRPGQVVTSGLAVDADGSAYLTGAVEGQFPFTVPASEAGVFLAKLSPSGQALRFAVPAGGSTLALDGQGHVIAGGTLNNMVRVGFEQPTTPAKNPAGLANLPAQCLPNNYSTVQGATITEFDAASGSLVAARWIDGTSVGAGSFGTRVALDGSTAWVTGTTSRFDTALSPDAALPEGSRNVAAGAYLQRFDFSQMLAPEAPQVVCVTDGATQLRTGAAAPGQILSIFGPNLGPEESLSTIYPQTAETLGGVRVTFDGVPGGLLYVSATQINVAVPDSAGPSAVLRIETGAGASEPLKLPRAASNPSVFSQFSPHPQLDCLHFGPVPGGRFVAIARHADGSFNSCANPAKAGSIVSFYLGGAGLTESDDPGLQASINGSDVTVVNVTHETPYVLKVDVQIGDAVPGSITPINVLFRFRGSATGPYSVTSDTSVPTLLWLGR